MHAKPSSISKFVLSSLIAVIIVAYPFAVYFHLENLSPWVFALALLFLFLLRFFILLPSKSSIDYLSLSVVFVFCASVVIIDSEQALKFYPVLMNIIIGAGFILSLFAEKSLIERFAHAGKKKPPPQATGYLRRLSLAWGCLLIFNGVVSAYTACYTTLSTWALYNGFISYVLMAIFAAGELVYRGYYKKKNGIVDD